MYLHIGQGVMVPTKNIIGVFDIDNCSRSRTTKDFLNRAEKECRITILGDDIPKSFTLVQEGSGTRVYFSQISSSTLHRRSNSFVLE